MMDANYIGGQQMRFSLALFLAFLLSVPAGIIAQDEKTPTPEEKKEKLEQAAIAFLRETYSDVGNMRSLENRISFTAELAALLWYKDQRGGAAMFGAAVNDFKQLLAVYDGQINSMAPPDDDDDLYAGIPFLGEPTDRSRIERKFNTALGVRQQIAMSIAEHEPELAYNFFYDSVSLITNPKFREDIETSNEQYEQQLLSRIATSDAKRAAELAKRSLGKGVTSTHIRILRKLHSKDPEAAPAFGNELLNRLKSTSSEELQVPVVRSLLSLGDSTATPGKDGKSATPIYSVGKLVELGDILARAILEIEVTEDSDLPDLTLVEKYAPSRAVQIKARYAASGPKNSTRKVAVTGMPPPPPPKPMPISATGTGIGSSEPSSPAELRREARTKEMTEMMAEVETLGDGELPKEERERIIAKAREILGRTKSKSQKIGGLATLAGSVAKIGDKRLAAEIMLEAERLVERNPKNYMDLMNSFAFAAGQAVVDPDKAFPIFSDLIVRSNELISAVVTIAEFVDVNEEVIAEGEFQVGAFGGQMIQGFIRGAGVADSATKILIDADFEKTKALTNRFDRAELRILSKVMLLRTILGKEVSQDELLEEMLGPDFEMPDDKTK